MVKIGSGKAHPWTVKLGRNFDEEQDICIILKFTLSDCLLFENPTTTAVVSGELGNVLTG